MILIFNLLLFIFHKFNQSTLHEPPPEIYLCANFRAFQMNKQITRLACSMCLSQKMVIANDSLPLNQNKTENLQFHFQGQVSFD